MAELAGLVLPLMVLAFLVRRAWRNGRRNGARMRELNQLKREWQARAERGEIPQTCADAEGITSSPGLEQVPGGSDDAFPS